MDPVEINAGGWYLRALRADDRVDDRPALADGGIDDPDYVADRAREWANETPFLGGVRADHRRVAREVGPHPARTPRP